MYVCVFRKWNSINPINHKLSFCEARSCIPLVKCVFLKIIYTRGTHDLAPQKLSLWLIGLIEFNFLKTQTYLHKICQLSVIHLPFASAILRGEIDFEDEHCWKMHYLSEQILKFHKLGKVSTTKQNSSWKLVSWVKFPRVLWIFPASAKNPTRGVS